MPQQWIFTAGTSLLENVKHPDKLNDRALSAQFDLKNASDWVKILPPQPKLQGTVREKLVKFAAPFAQLDLGQLDGLKKTTAEIASYFLLRQSLPNEAVHLVFLCSETGPGVFCALVNAMLLGYQVRCFHKLDAYRPVPQPRLELSGFTEAELGQSGSRAPQLFHPQLANMRLATVDLLIIEKLDPQTPDLFKSVAIPNLIEAIAEIHFNRKMQEETLLNYTGGFKVIIPTLTQAVSLASAIEIVCFHEDASQLIRQHLVPLVLPKETEQDLRWAGQTNKGNKQPFDPKKNQRDLFNPQWGGYATWRGLKSAIRGEDQPFYEEGRQGEPQLSALGKAARAMLDARDAWLEKRTHV